MVAAAACGDSRPSGTPSPPPSVGEPIRGTERLGWDQQAASQSELRTFTYAVYVDGTRSVLLDVTCGGTVTFNGFPCSARLPSMTPGQHTLELATFIIVDGVVTESPKSPPLRVNVTPAITGPSSEIAPSAGRRAPDEPGLPTAVTRHQVRVAATFDGFEDIGDVAVSRDGKIFVAERRGVVRLIAGGVTDPRPVLLAGERLVSIALDPEFERTGFVYALQADPPELNTSALRLVRYREAGGSFGERAVIVESLPGNGEPPSGSVRVGPDGKLYVTTFVPRADGDDALGGRLLRLEADGTTPADQPPGDPVFAAGFASIRGFDWQPRAASMWIADGSSTFDRLAVVAADPRRARLRTTGGEQPLTPGTRIAALRFYEGDAIPSLRNTLLVAAQTGLLSMRFDRRSPSRVTSVDTLIETPMRAIVPAASGVYVASESSVLLLQRLR